jgi:hypothetical protein
MTACRAWGSFALATAMGVVSIDRVASITWAKLVFILFSSLGVSMRIAYIAFF